MTSTVVLLHSPLTTVTAWGALPDRLRRLGHDVVTPDVDEDGEPPYAARYVASVAHTLQRAVGGGRCVLVGHSGAGPLLPQVGFARHSAQAPVDGYVFLDAMLPRVPRGTTRLQLLHIEDDAYAHQLEEHLRSGGRFPDWDDDQLAESVPDPTARGAVMASLRPRGLDFFTEPLPAAEDWPDAPVAYLQLSAAYDQPATTARHRGWAVSALELHHFAALTDPDRVAAALSRALTDL